MSESDGERAARSVALEQAYVHEVYEQCAEKTAQSKHWPRIYKFLEELEPGALVCDIGCGNGKYLSVNENVFKVGADRCKRLTDIAREKENEVLMCDNLALPFRDESFDAVLSISVVHHFATTERRVNALKELARVLRIGGRLVISVWAMEQKHRKFESQDVLVPWPKAYCLNSRSRTKNVSCTRPPDYSGKSFDASGVACINDDDEDDVDDDDEEDDNEEDLVELDRLSQQEQKRGLVTSRKRGASDDRPRCKNRSYWIDPIFSPSPSTSSLSSPNETCYSFFRRALQKLAGGKRGSRAWFLETWQNGGCKNRRRRRRRRGERRNNYEYDEIGDVDDIPIELRRLEDDNVTLTNKRLMLPDSISMKSKSLGDILDIERADLVRSRSSIPGFSSTLTSEFYLDEVSKTPSPTPLDLESYQPTVITTNTTTMTMTTTMTTTTTTRTNKSGVVAAVSSSLSSGSFASSSSNSNNSKPRLVKQKSHVPDDISLEFMEKPNNRSDNNNAVIRQVISDDRLAEFQDDHQRLATRRGNVQKQSSMNEELMSMERLMERERVRGNIMKQASLNEEIICKPSGNRTLGHLRDTLYSGSATKRLQLIKSDLTNRLKQSTTSMEKVSSMAIKNGFVKILQSWTQSSDISVIGTTGENENSTVKTTSTTTDEIGDATGSVDEAKSNDSSTIDNAQSGGIVGKLALSQEQGEANENRRLSKEDGSDSSKDSSLQSDTSVDSEDSFASVIYVPTNQQQQQQQQHLKHHYHHSYQHHHHHYPDGTSNNQFPSLIDVTTTTTIAFGSNGPTGACQQLRTTSAPPSPRIKHPPDIHGPRIKLMSPLLKQFPATSKSLPPPSPPGLSPRNLNPFPSTTRPFFSATDFFPNSPQQSPTTTTTITTATTTTTTTNNREDNDNIDNSDKPCSASDEKIEEKVEELGPTTSETKSIEQIEESTKNKMDDETERMEEDSSTEKGESSSESANDEDDSSRHSRLNQIKELLRQKPGFATRCGKSSFPLVRRASTATTVGGRTEVGSYARTLPRLLSLELFNPETDDLDSDSSGVSSPESVGSVISVISDERFVQKKAAEAATIASAASSSTIIRDTTKSGNNSNSNINNSKNNDGDEITNVKNEGDEEKRATAIGDDNIDGQIAMPDQFGVNLINDIEKYCRQEEQVTTRIVDNSIPLISNTAKCGKRSSSSYASDGKTSNVETIDRATSRIGDLRTNCKYSQLVDDTIAWLSGATGPEIGDDETPHYSADHHQNYEQDNNKKIIARNQRGLSKNDETIDVISANRDEAATKFIINDDHEATIDDFVMVTNRGECMVGREDGRENIQRVIASPSTDNDNKKYVGDETRSSPSGKLLIEIKGDSMESDGASGRTTTTESDTSRLLLNSGCADSTISIGSDSIEYKSLRERRKHLYQQKRSASEEIASRNKDGLAGALGINAKNNIKNGLRAAHSSILRSGRRGIANVERYPNNNFLKNNANLLLSESSSQESLPSDRGSSGGAGAGGAITYHQYYHVFREGELDQLINKYVENLHIISSYYDHASWCIIAEKVQVWTI